MQNIQVKVAVWERAKSTAGGHTLKKKQKQNKKKTAKEFQHILCNLYVNELPVAGHFTSVWTDTCRFDSVQHNHVSVSPGDTRSLHQVIH